MWTINGIGTKLCGEKKIASDSSYQATKWFVIFFMPIIPLKTFRVLEIPKYNLLGEDDQSKEYKMLPIKLDIIQIIKTFLSYWGGLLAFFLISFLLVEYDLYFTFLYFIFLWQLVLYLWFMKYFLNEINNACFNSS